MRRLGSTILGLMLAVAAAGCDDQLIVENTNDPDRIRALARPTDVENLVAGQFRVVHNAWWGTTNLQAQVAQMGLESYSANANFGMNVRSAIPRSLIDNGRGNPADFYGTYLSLNQAARAAALGLSRLNRSDFTFYPADLTQTARARAFSYFVKGVALGYLALVFDSNAVITADDDPDVANPLVAYDSVMRVAQADLDSAISISRTMLALPNAAGQLNWIPTTVVLAGNSTRTGTFQRLAYSFKARFAAGVARTPSERAAVNWASVILWADSGITADFFVVAQNVTGGWSYRPMQMDLFQSWHQMWQPMLGMADSSGAYLTWLGAARANKLPFVVVTADRRMPAGTARPAQQTASGTTPPGTFPYFRNRPSGEDVAVDGLSYSFYDFYRFQAIYAANRNGNLLQIPREEMDLLAAEGYIRAGDFTNAMTRINLSRVAASLPALAGITTLADPVPGGNACVPRVPTGARDATAESPTANACGNIMEALKWEKRLEIAFVYPGGWYFEGRGWGDLPIGTQLHFPTPYTELDARRMPIYSGPQMNPTNSVSAAYTSTERFSNSASNYGLGN